MNDDDVDRVRARSSSALSSAGCEHHVAILFELVALDHVGSLDRHVLLQAEVLLLHARAAGVEQVEADARPRSPSPSRACTGIDTSPKLSDSEAMDRAAMGSPGMNEPPAYHRARRDRPTGAAWPGAEAATAHPCVRRDDCTLETLRCTLEGPRQCPSVSISRHGAAPGPRRFPPTRARTIPTARSDRAEPTENEDDESRSSPGPGVRRRLCQHASPAPPSQPSCAREHLSTTRRRSPTSST